MISNLEEKQKIIELLTISMCSAPMTPSKNYILSQWYKKWGDFSRGKTILRLYKGHLVKTKGQAKAEGADCEWLYPELDAVLQNTVDEYTSKYVNMKTRRKNFSKNIEVFVEDLEAYRKSCENILNKKLGKYGRKISIKNTSGYLKRLRGNSLTAGMLDLAQYSVFHKFDDTHRKQLYSGTYDDVIRYVDEYIAQKKLEDE